MLMSGIAAANPANQSALEKHFGDLFTGQLQKCSLCHVSDHGQGAGSLDEFPHNPFGDAIRAAGDRLIDEGAEDSIPDRMKLIAAEDADKDGVTNLVEILLGSMPGLADDVPDSKTLAKQSDLLAKYDARLNRYPWRPFRQVVRPSVPTERGVPEGSGDWGHNPIDAFVAAKHLEQGLQPMGEASAEQLIRRVYLDLIGLSPSADEIREFVAAYSHDKIAYDRLVDRLLEHPAYGERWGRHWMDVWRYSDWAGYKQALRDSQRHIWHWRDWIVESLNDDKGYDRMVMQMLAADEMQVAESELRATGYLARNYFANRDQWMDNVVKHTSQAFLGITLGCAKCHDHMDDPFEQTEYYAMRAVFEPYQVRTDRVPGELDIANDGIPRVYDQTLSAKTFVFNRGDERFPIKDEPVAPAAPETLGGRLAVSPVTLTRDATRPASRPFVIRDLLAVAENKIQASRGDQQRFAAEKALEALQAELDLEQRVDAGLAKSSEQWKEAAKTILVLQREAEKAAAEWALQQAQTKLSSADAVLKKAESQKQAAAIKKAKTAQAAATKAAQAAQARLDKAVEESNQEVTTKFSARPQTVYPEQSSGRRLALARWIVAPENPLAARVAMNHIWLRHFGRAIVPTVNDFGLGGRPPTHPALLDWLAAELMDSDWSMKRMHRLIVTSATYRLSSSSDQANQSIDPDNESYWRGPNRRMEGEIVRDNLLHLAGRMDRSMGGPDIDHNLAQQSPRRSIYLRHAHEKLVEFVQIFDGPAVSECYSRETSIQPHQALALANSKLSVDAADAIVKQLSADDLNNDAFIQRSFLKILGRTPTSDELAACSEFLDQGQQPRKNLILVLLNHNDFVTIR